MFSRDAQHTAASAAATPPLTRIIWQTPVDLQPQYGGGGQYLLTHYGSPIISSMNTVLVPVKVGAQGTFRIEARSGGNGGLIWSENSDYIVPPHNWFPSFNLTLTANGRMYAPGSGGKLLFRDNVDSATGTLQTVVFYGANVYNAARAELDAAVMVSTPVTVDAEWQCLLRLLRQRGQFRGTDQRSGARLLHGCRHLAAREHAGERRERGPRRHEQRAGPVRGRHDAVRRGEQCAAARLPAGDRQRHAHDDDPRTTARSGQ